MTIAWTPPLLLQSHRPSEVWNALVSHCGTPIPLSSKGVTALFEPAVSPRHARVAALIEAASLRAVVLFDSFPFASLFEANIDADDLEHLPVALRDVLIEGMVSIFWSLIPQNRLPRYSILGVGDWQENAAEAGHALDWLTVSIQGLGPQPARLRVGCVAVDVARALAGGELAARAAWSGMRSILTDEAVFTLGRMNVSLAQARALAPGDVIVLAAADEDLRMVRVGRDMHRFRQSEDEWTYLGFSSPRQQSRKMAAERDADMQNDAVVDDDAQPALDLSSLMLDLDFDIGGTRISLATLESWQVGAVVEFDPPALAEGLEVTMRVNGQAVAKGDLIRIDDRLAVRLTRMLVGGRQP